MSDPNYNDDPELAYHYECIGETVTDIAYAIFTRCGAASDYCLQHNGGDCLVFGGTNRLIFNAQGWSIDESHCTPHFIKAFKEVSDE